MSEYFDAFDRGATTERGVAAVAPEVFRGIYAMPAFVKIETGDLVASTDFWVRGLGFIELFSIPGRVVHLRRWAFQDVLLVPADATPHDAGNAVVTVSFSCVMSQLDEVAGACRTMMPDSVTGPYDTPWNTRDVEVRTPEGVRVVFTAPRDIDPDSPENRALEAAGIVAPDRRKEGHNGHHG